MAGPVFYLIPGLGADERVFRRLHLVGTVRVLDWLPPQSTTEPLAHYAARLAEAVPVGEECWLVGVSFGGILAQEVARLRPLARVVLISSLASPVELPFTLRLARATWLYRLFPPQLLKLMPRVAQWFFGARNGTEYKLLHQIIQDTDPVFAQWAIRQLLQWPGVAAARPAVRLHGTRDRLLPARGVAVEYRLTRGGHFMIVSHAAEISRILNQLAATQP
ncbi:alpha/beta hydrolase [Hymenobacter sp. ASUV-10]|uniref:Alpha/beta hydrolase n=1 Tax=Hymenobacter aranciens TaxID=3063996 RepID=A0ABT9B5M8_9BACT|nr:alpha/beta hydrolase [Hymenobacter sp. ASUV-10]MDO7873452.1 alpha/beta hydrolase [Hymenobacter sp. ASUV-10]